MKNHSLSFTLSIMLSALLALANVARAEDAGRIEFDEVATEVLESVGVVRIAIERKSGDTGAVSVEVATNSQGTATPGSDYQPVTALLEWADGDDDDRFIEVPILDDAEVEPDETIVLELSNPTGGAIVEPDENRSAIVLLDDDGGGPPGGDAGELKFDEDSIEVIEEAGIVMVTVERSRGEDGVVSVDYATTTDGTATPDSDFTPVMGTLVWPDGDDSNMTFTVPILDDALAEGEETITLVLSNATGGAVVSGERGRSTIVILASDGGGGGPPGGDDPGVLKFDESSFEVLESAGVAIITVERSMGEDGAVSVAYRSTGDGTASAGGDFEPVAGVLEWPNGDGTGRTFTVPIVDDGEVEVVESIQLVLESPTGGAAIDPERGSALVLILDDDGSGPPPPDDEPGVIKFDEMSFEVFEESGVAIVTVERSMGEGGVVSIDYATSDLDAVAGNDYTAVTGTLTWANGDGQDKTFVVPILDDTIEEGTEALLLTLENPTGGAVIDTSRGTAELRILPSDNGGGPPPPPGGEPGVLKLDSGTFQVLEQAGVAVITVERSMGEDGPASVDFMTFAGTATDGDDYTGVSGTLFWDHGDGSNKTFLVPIADDGLAEGNETFDVQLMNATGASLDLLRADAVVTIIDDDNTSCSANASTLCMLGGRFRIQIAWQAFDGRTGAARPQALSDRSGLFWFFSQDNAEVLFKMVDACESRGQFWIFSSATTNLGMTVTVTDTATGQTQSYLNGLGQRAEPILDTTTFGCAP